ncbi:BlaI/MecI/CopY family transcriptional regulator [bacterium]|nr:BlaI/MecI/CopY family transcriptional regulator [bacterium]
MARKKKADSGAPQLTGLELEIMQVVWDRGNATASEVGASLGKKRPLAGTTIHTVLANLRGKGFIEPIPTVERVLRFAPVVPKEKVATRSLRQVMRDFFGGSPQRLLAHLVKEEEVGEAELSELKSLLRESKKKESRP